MNLEADLEKQHNKQKSEFLSQLRGLGVDTTTYLVALQPEFSADNELIVSPPKSVPVPTLQAS